jgi:hypothetical protein
VDIIASWLPAALTTQIQQRWRDQHDVRTLVDGAELDRAVRNDHVDLLLIPSSVSRFQHNLLRTLNDRGCLPPVAMYAELDRASAVDIAAFAPPGFDHLLLRDFDDGPQRLTAHVLSRAPGNARLRLLESLTFAFGQLHDLAAAATRSMIEDPSRVRSLAALAASCGKQPWWIARELRRCGFRSPHGLVLCPSLVDAHHQACRDPAATVKQVAGRARAGDPRTLLRNLGDLARIETIEALRSVPSEEFVARLAAGLGAG